MSDQNPDLVFQEVDEELRRARMNALWKAYGKYVIAGAVLIVLLVAGREGWRAYVHSQEEAQSTVFGEASKAADKALQDGGSPLAVWQDVMPKLEGGYEALAGLRAAGVALSEGKVDAALEAYAAVEASDADISMKELSSLLAAMVQISHKGDLDGARARLSGLVGHEHPWSHSAQEQLALLDLRAGDLDSASSRFSSLANDSETPQSIRSRATEFNQMIDARKAAAAPAEEETAPAASDEAATEGEAQ
ncbi:tetratricopeptide repeat protein [Pseudokordiimonas caeni]|uniref:tetratricopeptide repeat protein n=1 Tax=Pseudokordiimonas caeni TaxID=2997908 RepID=UPI002810D143|nr:tetratricopeptide repeat protein [Pseudokordiimonas caeni]